MNASIFQLGFDYSHIMRRADNFYKLQDLQVSKIKDHKIKNYRRKIRIKLHEMAYYNFLLLSRICEKFTVFYL